MDPAPFEADLVEPGRRLDRYLWMTAVGIVLLAAALVAAYVTTREPEVTLSHSPGDVDEIASSTQAFAGQPVSRR